jgi:hypothetical protein
MDKIFEPFTAPGPRLPWLGKWLLDEVWTTQRYSALGPVEFLNQGEKRVNELEEIIAASAQRIYDELLSPVSSDRELYRFLTEDCPCAVVIFDGLSLREVPVILSLAAQSGMQTQTVGYSLAAIPSETMDFVDQRLGIRNTAPSQLPQRRELRERRIQAYYYAHLNQQYVLNPDAQALLLWSSFPDQTYSDSGARFAQHFEQIHKMLETAWQNTVQQIPKGRRILITSDHGYVYFGAGLSFVRDRPSLRPLSDFLRGERHRKLDAQEAPPDHPDLATIEGKNLAILRGRVQTHFQGPASNKLYRHGGLSLMEMLTPWIILEP